MYKMPTSGIGLIPKEVREGNILEDDRWKQFSDEELQMFADFMFNYESGIPTPETCHRLIRGCLTEMQKRNI